MTTHAKPCIVCGKELFNVFDASENQPEDGLYFRTRGQFGSTEFDPMDGSILEICVCDECIVKARDEGKVLYGREAKPVLAIDPDFSDMPPVTVGWCNVVNRPLMDWTGKEATSYSETPGEDVLVIDWEDIGARDANGDPLYPEITWLPGAKSRAKEGQKRTEEVEIAKSTLLVFMESSSEARWAASWLSSLETALLGDPGYEWLVNRAGGWWVHGDEPPSFRRFVPGTLEELRAQK